MLKINFLKYLLVFSFCNQTLIYYIVKMDIKEVEWTGEDLIFLSQVAGIFGFHWSGMFVELSAYREGHDFMGFIVPVVWFCIL